MSSVEEMSEILNKEVDKIGLQNKLFERTVSFEELRKIICRLR